MTEAVTAATDLHAKGEDGDKDLEDQRQCQLPERSVDSWTSGSVRDVVHGSAHVGVVDVVAELR